MTELPSNDDGNKNLNSFHEALNSDLPTRGRIKNITEDKDDVVASMDGGNKVQLIHSISNLGGTRLLSKDKILGIIGMEQQGICVELIPDSVATDCNFPRFKLGRLQNMPIKERFGRIGGRRWWNIQ